MNTGARIRTERRLAAILAADIAGYSRLIGAEEEHLPTPQVSPRRRDRPEDCQPSRSLGQDHRHRVGSSNSAALSMHYAVLSRCSRRCVCATRVSLGTDADFSKLFYATEGNRAGKRFPKFRPGVSAAFRTAEKPSTRYPGLSTR